MTIYGAKRKQAIVPCLGFLLFAAVGDSHGARGLAIFLVILGVVLGAFVARRPRLAADAHGLTVANFVGTVRIPWDDITGFALQWSGLVMGSCLLVRRRNGAEVKALVVNDSRRSGYSSRRVEEIVDDLRRRLVEAGGAIDADEPARVSLPAAQPQSLRRWRIYYDGIWLVLCVFFIGFGSYTAWNAAVSLPQAYAQLRAHGVHTKAVFAGCSVIDLRTTECRLTLRFGGVTNTWAYSSDYPQFNGLRIGAPVAVIVDPTNPTTVYTVHDVMTNDNAGFGVLSVFGVIMAILGVIGVVWYLRFQRRLDRRMRRLHSELAALVEERS